MIAWLKFRLTESPSVIIRKLAVQEGMESKLNAFCVGVSDCTWGFRSDLDWQTIHMQTLRFSTN
jgi:hypothetical protein